MSKTAFALVLCDVPAHALTAGCLFEADPALVKTLAAAGSVDPHKDAVSHARTQGAQVQRSAIDVAAEKLAAEVDAKRVEIAHLLDLAGKAEGETAASLARQIQAAEAELASLQA